MRSAADRDRLVEAINSSSAYGDTFAEPVRDREKVKGYCLKEMTSEAAYRTGIRRVKGSVLRRARPSSENLEFARLYLVQPACTVGRIDDEGRPTGQTRGGETMKPQARSA
jgi:hypothetical protein